MATPLMREGCNTTSYLGNRVRTPIGLGVGLHPAPVPAGSGWPRVGRRHGKIPLFFVRRAAQVAHLSGLGF